MATIIKLKTGSGAPSTLAQGEAAFDMQNKVLYIGGTGGVVTKISDPGAVDAALLEITRVETEYKADDAQIIADYEAADQALSDRIDAINTDLAGVVTVASDQTITGAKTFATIMVPTKVAGENSTYAASTAFVATAVANGVNQAVLQANGTPLTVTGDVTGTGNVAEGVALTLSDVGTAGTYAKVTTDSKGRVISGAALTAADIPDLTTSKITDFATAVDAKITATTLDKLAKPVATVDMNDQVLTGLAAPVDGSDAANKTYVDSVAQGLSVKASVRAATTANVALTGLLTVDGVTLVAGDRVLVKNQTSAPTNGLYVAAAGAWTRTPNADEWNELVSAYVFVEEGTSLADTGWVCTVNQGGTVGTTDVTWAQFSSSGEVGAGNGLLKTGNDLSVVGTANRITVSAAGVDIASTYAGQASITTVGTIATGTWNGTAIDVAHGGTGLTTAVNGMVKGNGTAYAAAVDGTDYMSKTKTDEAIAAALVEINGGTY